MSWLKSSVKKFLQRYDISVLSESNRCQKKPPQQYFTDPQNKNVIMNESVLCETEPVITLNIPLSQLEAIAAIESVFFDHSEYVSNRRVFRNWIEQQREESRLQEESEAVKRAFEHYSALLSLCSNGERKIVYQPKEERNA